MTTKTIIEFAVKGITADIRQLEKDIDKGRKLIEDIRDGVSVNTTKSEYEILEIVEAKRLEIEELTSKRFNLDWELQTNEDLI